MSSGILWFNDTVWLFLWREFRFKTPIYCKKKKKSVSIELFSHNQITKQKGAIYIFDNFESSY